MNYLFTRLWFSQLSPFLPYLLGLLLFLFLNSFDLIYLCDGESLEQLKANLELETNKLNYAYEKFNTWSDAYYGGNSRLKLDTEMKKFLTQMASKELNDADYLTNKIKSIQADILNLDPSFEPPTKIIYPKLFKI